MVSPRLHGIDKRLLRGQRLVKLAIRLQFLVALVKECVLTGDFLAFDAKEGKVLFKYNLGGPAAGGLMSYAAGGNQYVGVVSGFVGGYYHQFAPAIEGGNPTITVFALKP